MLVPPLKVRDGKFRYADDLPALAAFARHYLLEPQGSLPHDPEFGAGAVRGLAWIPWGTRSNPLATLESIAAVIRRRYGGLFLARTEKVELPLDPEIKKTLPKDCHPCARRLVVSVRDHPEYRVDLEVR